MNIKCEGQVPEDSCGNAAIYRVDTEDTWSDEPTWVNTVPMCEDCMSNAHRGGFGHSQIIT